MESLGDIQQAEAKVLADTRALLRELSRLSAADVDSHGEAIVRLRQIRTIVYESLNQIQHEHLIIRGLRWLCANGYAGDHLVWHWNPRQTGDATEPDLLARDDHQIFVSAEATTSERPIGTIDSRMHHTLAKLSVMAGDKFYFVRTSAMATRALTKIRVNSWDIQVVRIDSDPIDALNRST